MVGKLGLAQLTAVHRDERVTVAALARGITSVNCIGWLPAAISAGIGSQVQRPLATVVVRRMYIGPTILLVVVPALQTLVLEQFQPPAPMTSQL